MLVAITLLCLVLLGSSHGASPPPPSVSTFVIQPNSQETVTVGMVNSDGNSVGCKLEYDTSAVSNSEKKYEPADKLIKQITKKYNCLSTNLGIFTYSVCLGSKIEQKADNGDSYILGQFSNVEESHKPVQQYTEGTYCEAARASRRTVVEFACSEQARVMSIDENAVCQYRIIVGVPEVCGHPGFSAVSKLESWLVEISETDTGEMICQAYNNGYDVIATTTFSKFSLSFTSANNHLAKYVVRRKNRQPVDGVSVEMSPARVTVQERTQVDYAKIVAE